MSNVLGGPRIYGRKCGGGAAPPAALEKVLRARKHLSRNKNFLRMGQRSVGLIELDVSLLVHKLMN